MSCKKNVFSYLLWLLYTIMTCGGIYRMVFLWQERMEICQTIGFAVAGAWGLVACLLVLLLRKIFVNKVQNKEKQTLWTYMLEGILMVTFLAIGIVLRVGHVTEAITASQNELYFEATRIVEGQSIPQVVHGATYIYLQLLRFVFLVFGNKVSAAIWLQIVLQMVSSVFLYFAVRRLSGPIAALITEGFYMISSHMIMEAVHLSPEGFFLLFYALTLMSMAAVLHKQYKNIWLYLLTGMLVGACCYLDVFGVSLFAVILWVFAVNRQGNAKVKNEKIRIFFGLLLGAIVSFLAIIAIDALCSNKDVLNVLRAWGMLYCPQLPAMPDFYFGKLEMYEMTTLLAILVIGIFSFWCRKHLEIQTVWMGMILLHALMQCFCMATEQVDGSALWYFLIIALAGTGIESIFASKKQIVVVNDLEDESLENNWEEFPQDVVESKEELEILELGKVPDGKRKVQFLENPLPLPKKHEAKVMDYKLTEVSADSDYDFAVSENEDFDI